MNVNFHLRSFYWKYENCCWPNVQYVLKFYKTLMHASIPLGSVRHSRQCAIPLSFGTVLQCGPQLFVDHVKVSCGLCIKYIKRTHAVER